MILPDDQTKRDAEYRNLVRECDLSRNDRQALHRRMRTVYLNGSDSMEPVVYNRILEFVDTSSSYLYDPESPMFVVSAGDQYGDDYREEEEAASDYIQREWIKRYTLEAMSSVEYAHVYPSIIVKTFADRRGVKVVSLDDPADFGVWRESLPTIHGQEAFCHYYNMPLPSFVRWAQTLDLSKDFRDRLVLAASEYASRESAVTGSGGVLSPTQGRLIISSASPMIGAAQAAPYVSMANPQSDAKVIPMAELYVFDDKLGDYRVVTLFRPTEEVMCEVENPQPGIPIFHKLTLFPTKGYIWGLSPIERMIALQMWRDNQMAGINDLMELNLDPPRAYLGIAGMTDEKAKRLNTPGGHFTSPQPGGDIKSLAPPIPPDVWTMVDGIDRMFDRLGGLPPGSDVAADQANMRAGDQLATAASLGSPRTRKRAMYVEAFVNDVATSILKLRQQAPVKLIKPQSGEPFLLGQIPSADLTATIAGHTASPLYSERTFERALLVYDRQAIDDETLVQFSGLPMQAQLRAKARSIQRAKADRAKGMMEMQNRELETKEKTADAKVVSAESSKLKALKS